MKTSIRALSAVAAAAIVASGSAAPPSLRGTIVFTRAGGLYGDETIFVAHADGTGQRQVTRRGIHCCPRITRDGRRLLLAASGPGDRVTTATMNVDGRGYKTIRLPDATINLGPGAWSPNGRRIAFQVWDDHNHARDGLYIGSADGSNLKRLTHARRGADLPGDFSPGGARLAFFRERVDVQGVGSVWVINVDGTGLRQLSPRGFAAGSTVRWSPDGTRILFQTARNQAEGALWTVRPDGTHVTRVFNRRGRFAITPTWSPDGTKIMFALNPTADEFSHPPNGLYVIDADGTGLRLVIGGNDFKREPDWVR